jgi:hypothetical protein
LEHMENIFINLPSCKIAIGAGATWRKAKEEADATA